MSQSSIDADAKKLESPTAKSSLNRRKFLAGMAQTAVLASVEGGKLSAQGATAPLNLAKVAIPSSMANTSENKISWLNEGGTPAHSRDRRAGTYMIRSGFRRDASDGPTPPHWVQYDWSAPISINKIEVFWAIDPPRPESTFPGGALRNPGLKAPTTYRIAYWNDSEFVPVSNAQGLGVDPD